MVSSSISVASLMKSHLVDLKIVNPTLLDAAGSLWHIQEVIPRREDTTKAAILKI